MSNTINNLEIYSVSIALDELITACMITLDNGDKINYEAHNMMPVEAFKDLGGTVSSELAAHLGVDYLEDVAAALIKAAKAKFQSIAVMIASADMTFENSIAAFAAATNNDVYDAEYNGGEWMVDAVETHETLEQFEQSAKNWNERSGFQRGEIVGLKYICWTSCQAHRGQPRRSMWVIDFGDVRYAIDADARFYV